MAFVQSNQQAFQVRIDQHDLDSPLGRFGTSVPVCLAIRLHAVRVQQHQSFADGAGIWVLPQAPPRCFDDRQGIAAPAWFDVQVKVEAFVITDVPEKPHEGSVTLPFNPDEDHAPAADSTPAHVVSTEPREPTEHAPPILGIEADITPQAPHVLGTVKPGGPAAVLLDDKDLFFLQIVE